jgi:anti-anti-sigma factor
MALTMLPQLAVTARDVCDVGAVLTTELVQMEGGAHSVILLSGEADISSRAVLCEVLSRVIDWGSGDVVVDLADATFIDTAAVRVLATAQQVLDRAGRRLTFRSPSRLAFRVLEGFGLTGLVEAPDALRP